MKKLLNTLYVTTPESYLALDGENVLVKLDDEILGRVPLHNLESIVTMGYLGASPALMGKCAKENINLTFLKSSGRFLAKVTGPAYGNILLRKQQYRMADNTTDSLDIAKSFVVGKLYNSKSVVERACRDYPMRVDVLQLKKVSAQLSDAMKAAYKSENMAQLRGYEGEAATRYFSVINQLILQQKDDFYFEKRSKRPPKDNFNTILSFSYTLLMSMCVSALESVGLDPYAGYMHTDRPGRVSLALDLMEELRPVMADRFALTIVNKRQISAKDFVQKENGAVLMDDDARKKVLNLWQDRKKDVVIHPFLGEKIPWGLLPYVQAMLLARFIRGDIDAYTPYAWK